MELPSIILKNGKDKSLMRKHPWVFSGAIYKVITDDGVPPENGALVRVLDSREQFIAVGFFNDGTIAVRVISFSDEIIDQAYWNKKIEEAFAVRKTIGLTDDKQTNMYRLFHAEGDGVPGLIIDFYNGTAVIQAHNSGVFNHIEAISEAIKAVYGNSLLAIYNKSAEALAKQHEGDVENGYIYESGKVETLGLEHNCRYNLDWINGQKTGFFLDQRENRALLGRYSKGKSVLNTFCYSGGFSVAALVNEAKLVHSVDSSQKAIDLTNENVALNKLSNHEAYCEDTMDFLKATENTYDIIVLDPPAYAKNQRAKHNAVQGYRRLNEIAFHKINKGGLLFTFSCSQAVHRKLFYDTITASAINAGRTVRVLHHLSQPADHPVNIYHPEGEYLKGLVLMVD